MFSDWKTSAAAIVLVALTIAFLMGIVTLEQYLPASVLVAGGGLFASADAKKR